MITLLIIKHVKEYYVTRPKMRVNILRTLYLLHFFKEIKYGVYKPKK
jgi:hypothetical protein